jgi:hypothetical protein
VVQRGEIYLGYSTYLGGSGGDKPWAITMDKAGSAYITGETFSLNFPLVDPIQSHNLGGGDAFVAKLSPSGSGLVYATYLGSPHADRGHGIAVDSRGNAYIAGVSTGSNFPTTSGAFQPNIASGCTGDTACADAFITKLSAEGSSLVYSTYLGGVAGDSGDEIAVDVTGNAYLKGMTNSQDFPTVNAVQPQYGGGGVCTQGSSSYPCKDAFVTKLNPQGSALVYSTYLGGNKDEGYGFGAGAIAIDPAGHAYVTGETKSPNFPIQNALLPTFRGGTTDAFVSKLTPDGSAFIYSTYWGGNNAEMGLGIAADALGNGYVTGVTYSNNFPTTTNSFQPNHQGESDAFVSKLNANGSGLAYSTFVGGNLWDVGADIVVDKAGDVYLTGTTYSTNFPTVAAFQSELHWVVDAYVTKLASAGNALKYSSYLGGTSSDDGFDIAIDRLGQAYVTGVTVSTDFPTINPLQPAKAGSTDAFLTKISRFTRDGVTA